MPQNKIIFIVGPTAVGKTDVAFILAKEIGAQIVSCDSMLVYKEPKIITSKPSAEMLKEVPHYMVDLISVEDNYSVFDYFQKAKPLIEKRAKSSLVIVCGGSGLYAQALIEGILIQPPKDEALREKMRKEAQEKGSGFLYQQLLKVDKKYARKISPSDLRRIIRALEVYKLSKIPFSKCEKKAEGLAQNYPLYVFGLNLERDTLYERINKRTEKMFTEGAIEEVERLLKLNLSQTAQKIIGIKEIGAFLEGKISLREAKEMMKKNTRNFAKRQLTWFRRKKYINWLEREKENTAQTAKAILKEAGLFKK